MSLSTNSRNVSGEYDLVWFVTSTLLSSLNLIQTVFTDGSFSISCAGLKEASDQISKQGIVFWRSRQSPWSSRELFFEVNVQQHWSKEFNGGNEANFGKVESEKHYPDRKQEPGHS